VWLTIYLGERLGLNRDLAKRRAATSSELAARTGTTERELRHRQGRHRDGAGVPQHQRGRCRSRPRRHQRSSQERERAGVADRVRFSVTDAADLGGAGGYNLMTIFEALHDMSRPVDALRAARQMLSDDGTLLVADGLVADEFTVPASTLERFAYGWSVVSCLPGAMGDPQTAATGGPCDPRCFVSTPFRPASARWRLSRSTPTTGASTDCSGEDPTTQAITFCQARRFDAP
jgi:hypothetical protein